MFTRDLRVFSSPWKVSDGSNQSRQCLIIVHHRWTFSCISLFGQAAHYNRDIVHGILSVESCMRSPRLKGQDWPFHGNLIAPTRVVPIAIKLGACWMYIMTFSITVVVEIQNVDTLKEEKVTKTYLTSHLFVCTQFYFHINRSCDIPGKRPATRAMLS